MTKDVIRKENAMKKLLIALLSLSLLVSAAGCHKPTEEELVRKAVSDYLSALLSEPMELLSASGEIIDNEGPFAELWTILNEMLKRTNCEVTDVRIEGDVATAELEFSTYDIGKSFSEMLDDYVDKLMDAYMSEGNWDKIDTEVILTECWKKTLGEQEETGLSLKVPFAMELDRTEDGWKVRDYASSQQLKDILAGGIFAAFDGEGF
ncbi:MAG: hypothetical protein IJM79_06010 [Erysipelotrichaceae bacterium]|nr:hypothetical protein [Erysipelotrichaceae bacterium]